MKNGYAGLDSNSVFTAAELGTARVILSIIFASYFPEELGKVEKYLSKWEDITSKFPVYSSLNTLQNPHITTAIVKWMLTSFIPWQVSDETLMTISKTVHEFGYYPIIEE